VVPDDFFWLGDLRILMERSYSFFFVSEDIVVFLTHSATFRLQQL
jgi:hypothetical protein